VLIEPVNSRIVGCLEVILGPEDLPHVLAQIIGGYILPIL
jgi:hypothetical protein